MSPNPYIMWRDRERGAGENIAIAAVTCEEDKSIKRPIVGVRDR